MMGNGMESTPLKVRYLTLTVPPELAGTEVNTLLRRHLGLSGTVLRRIKWLEDGITLDGVRVHVRVRVSPGQVLSARLSDPDTAGQPWPSQGALDIVYEDEDLAVVNKAPGMLVHPSHGHYADTVGNHLMGHYLDRREAAGFHPVHRLDKGTSGLLVTAKHPYGQEKLRNQLHTGDFRRVYLAVCRGVPHPLAGTIDAPIGPREGSLTAQQVRPDGKPARTHYRVLRDLGGGAGGAGAGHRAHPPDPGAHGPHELSPHRGRPVRRGDGPHPPARPPLRPGGADPSRHRSAAGAGLPAAGGHTGSDPILQLRKGVLNMAKKEKRFEIIHEEGNGLSIAYTVFLDTATGVQYLFAQSGYGGGLTPLLDRDGKPMTWEV